MPQFVWPGQEAGNQFGVDYSYVLKNIDCGITSFHHCLSAFGHNLLDFLLDSLDLDFTAWHSLENY